MLCEGCPIEFREYMEYTRRLSFEESPDYLMLIQLFEKCMGSNNINPFTKDFVWKRKAGGLKSTMNSTAKKPPIKVDAHMASLRSKNLTSPP